MLPEWIKEKYESYLLDRYIRTIEGLRYLRGDEYLKKLFFTTRICYDKELKDRDILHGSIELKAMDKVK